MARTLADYDGKRLLVRSNLDGWVGWVEQVTHIGGAAFDVPVWADELGHVFPDDSPGIFDVLEVIEVRDVRKSGVAEESRNGLLSANPGRAETGHQKAGR